MTTDIEVDLDLEPAPPVASRSSWLDQPKLVAGTIAAFGVVAVAAVAVIVPAIASNPTPVAAQAPACVDVAGRAPLPAFAITSAVAGSVPAYEDGGVWSWRQMILLPTDIGAEVGRELIQLQTADGAIEVRTAGDQQITVNVAGQAMPVRYPIGTFGGWAELTVSSTDHAEGDLIAVTVAASDDRTSQVRMFTPDTHGPLTGFALSTPVGAGSEVQYGPPAFVAAKVGC